MNQAEVASRVGISNEVYGRLERGVTTPRLSTLLRLCEVLEVEPNDLLLDGPTTTQRNERISPELRQLIAVAQDADPATIKRVTEITRWLRGARGGKRTGRSSP